MKNKKDMGCHNCYNAIVEKDKCAVWGGPLIKKEDEPDDFFCAMFYSKKDTYDISLQIYLQDINN